MRTVYNALVESVQLQAELCRVNLIDEQDLMRTFEISDTKCDGVLDLEEIKNFTGSQKILLTKKESDILMNIMDKDQDGVINKLDFISSFLNL